MTDTQEATRIPWRVDVSWSLDRYGLDQPFKEPAGWERADSGAGFGMRDTGWITPDLTADEVQAEVDTILSNELDISIKPWPPDWVYALDDERFNKASDAWEEFGTRLMLGEGCRPPQQEDF